MKEMDEQEQAGMESPEQTIKLPQIPATEPGSPQAQEDGEVPQQNGDLQNHRPQPLDSDRLLGVQEPQKEPLSFLWHTFTPLIFMVVAPNIAICGVSFVVTHGSSTSEAFRHGFKQFIYKAWTEHGTGAVDAWQFIIVYVLYSGMSIQALAGSPFYGPPTSTGHRPKYWHSGLTYYLLTIEFAIFFLLFQRLPCYPIYEALPGFTPVLVIVGVVVSVLVYLKGKIKPSPGEHGSTGSIVWDFFWGLELYPRIGAVFDVKLWTKGRFGMMLWQLLVLTSWKAQVEKTGWNWAMAATATLQSAYIAKFFYWERGYLKTMDISFDRAGFYQCWGNIGFLTPVHALTSFYMVKNSPDTSLFSGVFIIVLGVTMILLTYCSDYQKQILRETEGDCIIWGSAPKAIKATYRDASGKERTSLLLASGFWSFCRHPNYFFEILSSFCWVFPSGGKSLLPYMFVIYLTTLLTLRAERFENLCSKKYGEHWQTYCSLVKYKMIPYVF
ncbi:uncharacterized protein LOC144153773 [Haemaphysalis longicornis]